MYVNTFFYYAFMAVGLINLAHFFVYLTAANIYDIKQFKRQKRIANQKRRHDKLQLLVTVLIPAHNEEASIVRCLDSVRTNSYRKLQIIVIDDCSTDKTRSIIRGYLKQHANRDISLMFKRTNVGKASALNHALRTRARGTYVMMLDADSVLHKQAIKRAVHYFDEANVVGVAANVRVMDSPTILGLLQKFEHMVGYRSKKFYSLSNSEFIVGGVASTYRMDVLKKVRFYDTDTVTEDIGLSMKIAAQGNIENRLVYAADVVAMTEGVQTFKSLLRQRYRWKLGSFQNLFKYRRIIGVESRAYSRSLTIYRLPMAVISEILLLIEPLILLYLLYLSVMYQTTGLFIGAYLLITGYILWNIWPDEHASFRKKLSMSFYAPIMYFVFYIMQFVQIVSVIRTLLSPRKIARKADQNGTWISPERSGQAAQFS